MAEALYDLFSIVLGRYFFGLIGACLRFAWLRLTGNKVRFRDVWETQGDDDRGIDHEGFKSRMVGFVFILGLIILAVG